MMTINNDELADLLCDEQIMFKSESTGFDVWLEWSDECCDSYYVNVEWLRKQQFRIIATDIAEWECDTVISVNYILDVIMCGD